MTRIIGISGGSGSGKSTIVKRIKELYPETLLISMDNYYKSAPYINNSNITAFNFDHPDAFDTELLISNVTDLKSGKSVMMPQYDFVNHRRLDEMVLVESKPIIIIEGLMIFTDKRLRDLFDLKLFVDTPPDIRFIRRLERDIKERGRTMESVIEQYLNVVRPGHYNFIEPYKEYADLIIPEGGFNEKAMQVLFSFISSLLAE